MYYTTLNRYHQSGWQYTPQSGAIGTTLVAADASSTHQITAFSDETAGWKTEVNSSYDSTMELGETGNSDLGNFLERPVKIAQYSWAVASPLFEQFNPWALFCSDSRVREKLAHYELLRCNMNYKIIISGTGFHYGRALVSYNPFHNNDDVTVQRAFLDIDLVQASQKPNFFLNPTTNEGGEMKVPFFYPDNYMSLSRSDYNDMGEVSIKSFANLLHANGGNDAVTITVFAWASEAVLAMPTSLYTTQSGKMNSGDEYGKGIISAPATAIAKAAGALANAPMIGPYARATEISANAMGSVATCFGYSRPAIITDTGLYKPTVAGNMANTDAAEAVQKLTLDSKQEITVDSRTVGLDGADQMTLDSIVSRESYLTQFNWTPAQASESILWNAHVSPTLYRTDGLEIHPTPMSMVGQCFGKWQGTVKFRFQIVKSAFHKGKLLFRWDPRSHGSTIEYNTVYSRVVDIAEEEDFEIEIGWGQKNPFLNCSNMFASTATLFNTSRLTTDDTESFNGVLEVDVLNSLVSPGVDSSVSINVFVSMTPDAKFAAPDGGDLTQFSLYQPQSGSLMEPAASDIPEGAPALELIAGPVAETSHQMEVFFGEHISSLRQLLRRYALVKIWVNGSPGGDILKFQKYTISSLPYNYGYDPAGIEVQSTLPVNFTPQNPLTWFMPCYAGWRGSLRKKLIFDGNISDAPIVTRVGYKPFENSQITLLGANADLMQRTMSNVVSLETSSGAATTHRGQNSVIEVEVPYYNGTRFSPARQPGADFNNGAESISIEYTMFNNAAREIGGTKSFIHDWSATGEDFTLFFFTGCPIIYKYAIAAS